jgi:hypothetical protein
MTTYTAIIQALAQGCTGKTRALAQARNILREVGAWYPQHDLEDAWSIMLQDGRIIREGREYLAKIGGAK